MNASTHYLVFDGACELCQRLCRAVQQADRHHRLHAVTFGDPLTARLLASLPPDQWRDTFHLVSPDGKIRSGDDAMPAIMRLLPCGRPLAWLMTCPGIGRPLTSLVYRWLTGMHAPDPVLK